MKKRGFTLIELLVVISIIALMTSVVLSGVNVARAKARDARRISDIQQFKKGLELYYSQYGSYPASRDNAQGANWVYSYQDFYQTGEFQARVEKFLPTLPEDPINRDDPSRANNYEYYSAGGQAYYLIFRLERQNLNLDKAMTGFDCSGNWYVSAPTDGYLISAGNTVCP